MLEYPAIIKFNNAEQVYEVTFPDVKGCYTYGKSLEDAKNYAKKALSGWLEVTSEENMKIPEPSKKRGKMYITFLQNIMCLLQFFLGKNVRTSI